MQAALKDTGPKESKSQNNQEESNGVFSKIDLSDISEWTTHEQN